MHALRRSVRLCINSDSPPGDNGFAGTPPLASRARWLQIDVWCQGQTDPHTGYLIDIKDVDRAVHQTLAPRLEAAARANDSPLQYLASGLADLRARLPAQLAGIEVRLSPYHCIIMQYESGPVLLRVSFDFAAAHRLNNPRLSPEENRRLFGKCNSINAHGHNYRLEPSVETRLDANGEPFLTIAQLERIVNDTIIARFDHKHLNLDTPEFNDETGVNPTVENIARIFYDLLRTPIADTGAHLASITVWETDRTSATYPGVIR